MHTTASPRSIPSAIPSAIPSTVPSTVPAGSSTAGSDGSECRATTPRRRPRPATKRSPQLDALDADWRRASRRPANLRRARTWPGLVDDDRAAQALATVVDAATDLDDLVAATDRTTAPFPRSNEAMRSVAVDPDDVLRALVAAGRHDELAARVVLQRILPGVIASARRYRANTYNDDYTDIAIGAAWLVIRSFDVERRRRHVAATLVSDVVWSGFRRGLRRKAATEVPTPNGVFMRKAATPDPIDPISALAGTVRAAARAGIPEHELELIRQLARNESPGAVAREQEVTPRTIRNRRDHATAAIRAALGPDWYEWDDRLIVAA